LRKKKAKQGNFSMMAEGGKEVGTMGRADVVSCKKGALKPSIKQQPEGGGEIDVFGDKNPRKHAGRLSH